MQDPSRMLAGNLNAVDTVYILWEKGFDSILTNKWVCNSNYQMKLQHACLVRNYHN